MDNSAAVAQKVKDAKQAAAVQLVQLQQKYGKEGAAAMQQIMQMTPLKYKWVHKVRLQDHHPPCLTFPGHMLHPLSSHTKAHDGKALCLTVLGRELKVAHEPSCTQERVPCIMYCITVAPSLPCVCCSCMSCA